MSDNDSDADNKRSWKSDSYSLADVNDVELSRSLRTYIHFMHIAVLPRSCFSHEVLYPCIPLL